MDKVWTVVLLMGTVSGITCDAILPLAPEGNSSRTVAAGEGSQLNQPCLSPSDCRVNGSQCEFITKTCECEAPLVEQESKCIKKESQGTQSPRDKFEEFMDIVIFAILLVVILASLFTPFGESSIGKRLYLMVKRRFLLRVNMTAV